MMINQVRNKIAQEIVDYNFIIDNLKEFKKPRDKLSQLLRQGKLIRIKKGLYVFGRDFARRPYSRELLANLIYGPSYVSMEYALGYWGMIPENVPVITSMTLGKKREYNTKAGHFIYKPLSVKRYWPGIELVVEETGQSYLIATKEKAVVDTMWSRMLSVSTSDSDIAHLLYNDLRMDAGEIDSLNLDRLELIATAFQSRKIDRFIRFLSKDKSRE